MTDKTEKKLEFIISAAYFSILAAIIYIAFKYFIALIMPFVLALCLVSMLKPIIFFINGKIKVKKQILFVSFLILLYFLVGWLLFCLVMKLAQLIKDCYIVFPDYFQNHIMPTVKYILRELENVILMSPVDFGIDIDSLQRSILGSFQNLVVSASQKGFGIASSFTNSIPNFMISLIFTVMLSFFISLQYETVTLKIKSFIPSRWIYLFEDAQRAVKDCLLKYFRAYLILMFLTFFQLVIGLTVLGIPNSIMLGAGIALFDALPFLGTGAVMIPWILISLIKGNVPLAIGLCCLYLILTLVRSIAEPKIVGDQLGLNPIVSVLTVYVGFKLFGFLGMITFPILVQIVFTMCKNNNIGHFHV